jgi:hypothetical protein
MPYGLLTPDRPNGCLGIGRPQSDCITLKAWNNDPFNNGIHTIKNLILSPFVVNFVIKAPAITKYLL